MTDEWSETTIEEIAEKIAMGPFGSDIRTDNFVESGIPVIRGGNLTEGRFRGEDFVFLTEEKANELRNANAFPGDLVFTHRGTLGQVGLIPEGFYKRYVVSQSQMRLSCDRRKADPAFIYYFFKSPEGQHALLMNTSQTGVPAISRPTSSLKSIRLKLPSLNEQKAIAAVLGALDDKIELNRRMNATLEAIARALFQSWFVDFDPVRAKLDGRHPAGLDPATAALFPNQFNDSVLGPIPREWQVVKIEEIGEVICGKTPPTAVAEYYGDEIPFITIPDMHGNVFAVSTARQLSAAGANYQQNKTLPPGSICVSCIATPGLVVITSVKSQTNQQINSVVPRESDGTYFWYWVMKGLGAEITSSGSGGSVLTNLSKGRFKSIQVIKPPHALIEAYHSAVRPIFDKMLANAHEVRTLGGLRDTLLPKLLSGELTAFAHE